METIHKQLDTYTDILVVTVSSEVTKNENQSKFQVDIKFAKMHHHFNAVQLCTALPVSALGSFTIRQHRGRTDASVLVTHCCTLMQVLHRQVVQLFCCIFFGKPSKNWRALSGFWGFGEQMEIPASLSHCCGPPLLLSYSIWPHGLLTL